MSLHLLQLIDRMTDLLRGHMSYDTNPYTSLDPICCIEKYNAYNVDFYMEHAFGRRTGYIPIDPETDEAEILKFKNFTFYGGGGTLYLLVTLQDTFFAYEVKKVTRTGPEISISIADLVEILKSANSDEITIESFFIPCLPNKFITSIKNRDTWYEIQCENIGFRETQ